MDYLKAFTIGTAGLVSMTHIASIATKEPDYFEFDFHAYSIIAPIYYGLISMLALYLTTTYNLSTSKGFFITSIISITLVRLLNITSRHYYRPYNQFNFRQWINYALGNTTRHLFNINLVLPFLTTQYDTSIWWKLFILGNSALAYLPTYLSVIRLDKLGITNYDYKHFASLEHLIHAFDLLLFIAPLVLYFNYDLPTGSQSLANSPLLPTAFIIWRVLSSTLWVYFAQKLHLYNYQTLEEWFQAFIRVSLLGALKAYTIYYMIQNT